MEGLSPVLNARFGFEDYAFLVFFSWFTDHSQIQRHTSLELGYV